MASSGLQTVLQCRASVTVGALRAVLRSGWGWRPHGYRQGCYRYLYTGAVSLQFSELARVAALAQHLELGPLHRHLTQVPHLAGPLHTQVTPCQEVGAGLGSLPPHTHTDVVFRLEDGAVAAHKVTTASPRDT